MSFVPSQELYFGYYEASSGIRWYAHDEGGGDYVFDRRIDPETVMDELPDTLVIRENDVGIPYVVYDG